MDWQTCVTFLIIIAAAWRVWLEVLRLFATEDNSSCGGCHACPSSATEGEAEQLVSLELGLMSESESKS